MDYVEILHLIRPGAKWVMRGNTYEGLDWHDEIQSKPTEQEIMDGNDALKKLTYRDKRRIEYPPIGDQLDAIFKGGADFDTMKAQIQAVKNKYPKP